MQEALGSFDITFSSFASSLIFSTVGLWMFRQAKQRAQFKLIFLSIALMVYPYFTHGPFQDWGVGILLCGLAYYWWNE